MKTKHLPKKGVLYINQFPGNSFPPDRISDHAEAGSLHNFNISTVFILSSSPVKSDIYRGLLGSYINEGLPVSSFHIECLDHRNFNSVRAALVEIAACLARSNGLLVSYGNSCAAGLLQCLQIHAGMSAAEAHGSGGDVTARLGAAADEAILRDFSEYMNSRADGRQGKPDKTAGQIRIELFQTDKERSSMNGSRTIKDAIHKSSSISTRRARGEHTGSPTAAGAPAEPVESAGKAGYADPETLPLVDAAPVPRTGESAIKAVSVPEKLKERQKPESAAPAAPVPVRTQRFYTSLRFKLVSIISFIIVLSLSGMILLATYFFKKDNRVRVEENNLNYSEVIALKVMSDLDGTIKRAGIIASSLQNQRGGGIKPGAGAGLYDETDILFEGIAGNPGKDTLRFTARIVNEALVARQGLTEKTIDEAAQANTQSLMRSFSGDTVVQNVSRHFGSPVMALSMPFEKDAEGRAESIMVLFIRLDSIQKAFQSRGGITTAFMVNDAGDIIAHPEPGMVVSGGNYIDLPIVKMMMKSTIDNGQTRYKNEKGVFHIGSFRKIGTGGCGIIATVEEDKAFEEVYNIQRRNIYIMIIVLTSVIMVIFYFGKSITTPIIDLVGATKKIKEGDYSVGITPTTRDEIGELTSSFIEMGRGLEEREKIKSAFGKFVNKEIAEAAMRDELTLGGERKTVAILFSDIRSFTAISEKLQPEEVVEFLNLYMTRMVDCVNRSHGVVDKFIGDAIMAVWGTPVSKGNDTENAVNGALMMRSALLEFNSDRGSERKPYIRIGCGINTGQVLAGQIGSEDRMEYTVIGDAVNLASRVEALNKPFGTDILISEDSYALVKDIFAVERMQSIKVKGKEQPQQIYAVLGRFDDETRPKNVDEMRALLGIKTESFRRRHDDTDDIAHDEVKYEIIEQ